LVRILYLADIRFPLERANGIQTVETCYALADRGHTVLLFVRPDTVRPRRDPFEFYGLAPHARLRVARAFVSGSPPVRRAAYLGQSLTAVARDRSRTDVVITRDLGAASLLLRLPRWLRPPLVYESHGYAPVFAETMPELLAGGTDASPAKLRRLGRREERTWRLAEGYITISDGLAEDLRSRLGSRPALATIPDGVRIAANRSFVPPRTLTSPVVTYAGHLYPWKGVDVLLRAVALLPRVRAVVVGGHPAESDRSRLEGLASALGIADRVTFTGLVARPEVAVFLAGADVLVMPHTATAVSANYSSPLKLFEYLAAGKPIVASDVSSIREVLRDGENACLVRPADPESLAAGIEKVLDNRQLAERIARRAFEQAPEYTWARRAERIERLLEAVLRRR
jgi:glycosyltransferase involved in cell wall biosynthesis